MLATVLQRVLIIMALFVGGLQAQILHTKVENIIGTQNYQLHKGLITHLLRNEALFFDGQNVKYLHLFQTLQKNGLLDLRLQMLGDINLQFKVINNKKKGYKILSDTLETLGYKYFFTKVLENKEDHLLWDLSFKAEYSIDPVIFIKELQNHGVKVIDVQKLDHQRWYFSIDFTEAYLQKSVAIDTNEKVYFRKLLKPLLLNTPNINSLEIHSHNLNRWHPKITFFDKELELLDEVVYEKYQKRVSLKAPENTAYVKVTDQFNLINIKRGLTIIVR